MLEEGALGSAGGAGGVDDVGEVVGGGAGDRSGLGLRRDEARVDVEQHELLRAGGQLVGDVLRRDEHGSGAVTEHEGETLDGVRRIERDPGSASLEDGEDGDDEVQRALKAERDGDLGPDSERAQVVREAVGASVELRVGERLALEAQGGGVWRARGLGLEQRVRGGLAGEVPRRVVPLDEHPLLLVPLHQRQRGDGRLGLGRRRFEDRAQVAQQSVDGVRGEEVGAVLDAATQAPCCLLEGEGDVEPCCSRLAAQRAERETLDLQLLVRLVLEHQLDLEERREAETALGVDGLDQLLERQILVRIGAQRVRLHALQQLTEGWVAAQSRPQGELVDEEADEAFGLRAVAVGDVGADDEVLLSRVAGQDDLESGDQRHEERGALLAAHCVERVDQLTREHPFDPCALEALHQRTRKVRGELQLQRRSGQIRAPPVELGVERLALEPLALPDGEVGVLDGQR